MNRGVLLLYDCKMQYPWHHDGRKQELMMIMIRIKLITRSDLLIANIQSGCYAGLSVLPLTCEYVERSIMTTTKRNYKLEV